MTFRSRPLLNLAHKLHTCPLCGQYSPHGLEPAHSDSQKHGKGMGIKSKDEAGAICCDVCHNIIDGRTSVGMGRLQRQDMHEQANRRTVAWWNKEGFL